jgi:hypothetical protein
MAQVAMKASASDKLNLCFLKPPIPVSLSFINPIALQN